jgi:hypothetical protein
MAPLKQFHTTGLPVTRADNRDVTGKRRYNSLVLGIFSGVFQLKKLHGVEWKAMMNTNRQKTYISKMSVVYYTCRQLKRLNKTAKTSAKVVSNHDIQNGFITADHQPLP